MQAFFSEDQLGHDPQQFMRLGRIHKPADLPTRPLALRSALAARGIDTITPSDYGRAPLETVHSPDYLDFLESAYERWHALAGGAVQPGPEVLANMSPYVLDPAQRSEGVRGACPSPAVVAQAGWYLGDLSVPLGPLSWRSMLRSAHSAVAAAEAVIAAGTANPTITYALCRPSGHHARRDRASGFCYINNSAIAAELLCRQFGRVAVLDVDAHHGDGTQQIFYERADVMTISTHADPSNYFPFYVGYAQEPGSGAGEGFNLNLSLPHGSGNEVFFDALDRALDALQAYAPKALVLPLGFDTYKDDPISVLRFDFDAYRRVGERVRELGLPTVVVQEGGYMVDAIGPGLDAFLQGLGV
ncbi:histone deacetylase family protein [Pigmentiphaga aceris]|uniref:Histone deacetylase family protein n=1 Tax=Pigmentiphaga aceris TaxID=1940612 RepID=A0A5C0ATY4_9BURK|nr:histone deacetylase family protein [Pigmentiphaga aceris]QEI05134.1 histone deacetylase family protein [Pigmentiphaga aceris]